jgi:sodium pump decarboxylase gamma subunit
MRADLQFGLMLMIFGMGLVFLILAMLWGVIAIFQKIDRRVLAKEEEKSQMAAAAAAKPAEDIPPDLMAAILVALDRYRHESKSGASLPRRSPPPEIKPGQARWVAVGRSYQLRSNVVPRRRSNR